MKKLYLGLTTTSKSDWRAKIKEVAKFKIKELSLFPTFLKINERKELYEKLDKTNLKKIPHVHLRDDMESWEPEFFIKRYKTEVFNIHASQNFVSFLKSNKEYLSMIYVENCYGNLHANQKLFSLEKMIQNESVAGVCLDLSHLEGERQIYPHDFAITEKLLKKSVIGCNHISAIKNKCYADPIYGTCLDDHWLSDLSELDYLKSYPLEYF